MTEGVLSRFRKDRIPGTVPDCRHAIEAEKGLVTLSGMKGVHAEGAEGAEEGPGIVQRGRDAGKV
ncbi:MAG: hypothetical protein V3S41_10195, partial [Spirochaetia bacterium]